MKKEDSTFRRLEGDYLAQMEAFNKAIDKFISLLWLEIGQEEYIQRLQAIVAVCVKLRRSEIQQKKLPRKIQLAMENCVQSVWQVIGRWENMKRIRDMMLEYCLSTQPEPVTGVERARMEKSVAMYYETFWLLIWEREQKNRISEAVEAYGSQLPPDPDRAECLKTVQDMLCSLQRGMLEKCRRKAEAEKVAAAINDYCNKQEKQYDLYRSWWPDIWAEYRERCAGNGKDPDWLGSATDMLSALQEEKKNPKNRFSGKRA